MNHFRYLLTALLVVPGLLFAGCDTNEPDPPSESQLQVYLTDAPVDSLAAAFISVDRLELVADTVDEDDAAASDTVVLFDQPRTFDLLELRDTSAVGLLANVIIPHNDYQQLRLIVAGEGNYVVPEDDLDAEIPLRTPSGQQAGIKVNLPEFELDEDGAAVAALLDFDAEASIHRAGESGHYVLRPVIELVAFEVDGEEIGLDGVQNFELDGVETIRLSRRAVRSRLIRQ